MSLWRITGTVMISPERPARDIDQIVEAIAEQLTTLPGSQVELRLEIEAVVPSGLERAKVRIVRLKNRENAITVFQTAWPAPSGCAGSKKKTVFKGLLTCQAIKAGAFKARLGPDRLILLRI